MDPVVARRTLLACFNAAVAAVDPEEAVRCALGPLPGRVVVLALGKAAPAMTRGAARALGATELEGVVVSNHEAQVPPGVEFVVGGHPVPDEGSVAAGSALLRKAATLSADDTALVLVSGGGSALAEVPITGLTIADIAAVNTLLLKSGADIVAVNTVRRRLSQFKGGGLAAAALPALVMTLAVSDVVGDVPAAIASGPTVAPRDDPDAALRIVSDLGIASRLPRAAIAALAAPPPAHWSTTTGAGEYRIVAGAGQAAHAAAAAAERLGVPATVIDTRMTGDAVEAAGECLRRSGPGLSVFAGETTVAVEGDGVGGRNQEAALVAATLLEGTRGTWFLAAGTDGVDGTTPAAGAIVDGGTVARGNAIGLDAAAALDRNDSGSFFASLGEAVTIGPTGTNVGDLWLVLRTA